MEYNFNTDDNKNMLQWSESYFYNYNHNMPGPQCIYPEKGRNKFIFFSLKYFYKWIFILILGIL